MHFHLANKWVYINPRNPQPLPLSPTWRERIVVYECTSSIQHRILDPLYNMFLTDLSQTTWPNQCRAFRTNFHVKLIKHSNIWIAYGFRASSWMHEKYARMLYFPFSPTQRGNHHIQTYLSSIQHERTRPPIGLWPIHFKLPGLDE